MSETSSMIDSNRALLIDDNATPLAALEHECAVFTYYVIKQKPNGYVLSKYRQAHSNADFVCTSDTPAFDRLLLKLASTHPLLTRLVDAYTSIFLRSSIARRKWILLLAILESCAPTYRCFDAPESSSKASLVIGMLGKGVVFFSSLCLAFVLLMPLHLGYAAYGKLFGK